MKRTPTNINIETVPSSLRPFLLHAKIFDSSCSKEARVYFIDKDGGYFLKNAPKGTLAKEDLLGRYFHQKNLSAPIVAYVSEQTDWLLSCRVRGEDATDARYRNEPKRLAAYMGEILRTLHETDAVDCPIPNRLESYFDFADQNYRAGLFDLSYGNFSSADEAYRILCEGKGLLNNDTLIHGDFCLPNFLLDDFRFSGFIDLGNGGVGDRHIDLFWGAWTLRYNLKTDAYRDYFFDAYGKDRICAEALRVVSAAEVFG